MHINAPLAFAKSKRPGMTALEHPSDHHALASNSMANVGGDSLRQKKIHDSIVI